MTKKNNLLLSYEIKRNFFRSNGHILRFDQKQHISWNYRYTEIHQVQIEKRTCFLYNLNVTCVKILNLIDRKGGISQIQYHLYYFNMSLNDYTTPAYVLDALILHFWFDESETFLYDSLSEDEKEVIPRPPQKQQKRSDRCGLLKPRKLIFR